MCFVDPPSPPEPVKLPEPPPPAPDYIQAGNRQQAAKTAQKRGRGAGVDLTDLRRDLTIPNIGTSSGYEGLRLS